MSKNKISKVLTILEQVRRNGTGSVIYLFEDGTVLSQPISPEIFMGERKDTFTPLTEIIKIFNTTAHDLGAKDYVINN